MPSRRVVMDAAVTAQLGYGTYKDPITLSTEFKKYGWAVTGSPKGSRAVGWELIRTLLYQAGTEEPGLYISERCQSVWQTWPYCISDPKNPGDMTKDSPDHSADSCRYLLMAANQGQHNRPPVRIRQGAHPLHWKPEVEEGVWRNGVKYTNNSIVRRG